MAVLQALERTFLVVLGTKAPTPFPASLTFTAALNKSFRRF